MSSMIVGRLHVSFDRGVKSNKAMDLGLDERPAETTDGGLVRGLGTHFRDPAAYENAKKLSREETRIRNAFRSEFVSSTIPGMYVLPDRGDGRRLLESLAIDPEVAASVAEYELSFSDVPPVEIMEWASRVKAQLSDVSLGKGTDPSTEGLATLAKLADCPVLDDSTRDEIKGMIAATKLGALTRVELKREIEFVEVKLTASIVTPRRGRPKVAPVKTSAPLAPRRGRKAKAQVEDETSGTSGEAAA